MSLAKGHAAVRQVTARLAKQCLLGLRPPECSIGPRLVAAALVKAEAFAMDLEQSLDRRPVLTVPSHSFAECARIEFSSASLANARKYSIGFGGQGLAQTLLKIGRNTPRQAQHVNERLSCPSPFSAL